MNVLVVLAHHERHSFNGALFDTAVSVLSEAGHSVVTSDLHRMHFDPVSDRRNFMAAKDPAYLKQQVEEVHATETAGFVPELEAEIRKVESCDLMIWQFPLWWFSVPAILKGWVDRVFAMGRVYGGGRAYHTGMLRNKRAMLSVTIGGLEDAYVRGGRNGDIDAILRPIQRGMLAFTGFSVLAPALFHGPARVDDARRKQWLEDYAVRLRRIADEQPIEVGEY
jgi:NAD(P)H dehydrogenase (quinone)